MPTNHAANKLLAEYISRIWCDSHLHHIGHWHWFLIGSVMVRYDPETGMVDVDDDMQISIADPDLLDKLDNAVTARNAKLHSRWYRWQGDDHG